MSSFEPAITIEHGKIYNFWSGMHPDYDGNQVLVNHYYRPGHLVPDGVGGEVIIGIPTVVGTIMEPGGKVLCKEMCFPACWCV